MDVKKGKTEKKDRLFLVALMAFCAVCVLYYFSHEMSQYSTTLYALSYRYGFISRGFIGTVWQWLDQILPFDLMNYYSIYHMNLLFTAILLLFFFGFYALCLRCIPEEQKSSAKYLILFFSVFSFPMFVTRQNLGRIDIFLIMITLLCLMLLISGKAEWLILPLCVLAMLIHQGFVFTNINIILTLLLYKAYSGKNKKRYLWIFAVTLLAVSALFLYFEFFSHHAGEAVYQEVAEEARALSQNGEYYEMLLKHELLGGDVYEDEAFWHLQNRVETPIFLLLFLPLLIPACCFIRAAWQKTEKEKRWLYLLLFAGAGTLLPEIILKVDYGRYVYAAVFYYMTLILALMCMGDRPIPQAVLQIKDRLKQKSHFSILLLLYPLLFMPLYDTEISKLTYQIMRLIGYRE